MEGQADGDQILMRVVWQEVRGEGRARRPRVEVPEVRLADCGAEGYGRCAEDR
jgi:hypothetical protein